MAKLFPNENLRKYMWEYLASLMLGTNQNQTFNLFTGVGSNGKSILVTFLSLALGDYKGTVPISLVTQKRLGLGGTSSEVAQLKGIRFAVMNEPSKGDKINEGIMKELTGGDPIQARELYKSSVTFTPMFKMACCTNTLFDIESNDEGTWRRIRVVEFESKFVDNPSSDPADKEFAKDKDLNSKIPLWAPVFAAMLIDVVNKTKGIVNDCDEVLAPSKKYRESQDYLAKFVSDKIKESSDAKKKISKTNIVNEFKEWWKREYSRKPPKAQELVDYLNIKLGPYKDRGWRGYEIVYEDYDTDDD
jgi:P4 family phage/plasmid primase-like protien